MDSKARNNNIDIIKGIAIILMVYGHTFGVARDFIYLFHMPVFIFVSGYCFKEKHLGQCDGVKFEALSAYLEILWPFDDNICKCVLNIGHNIKILFSELDLNQRPLAKTRVLYLLSYPRCRLSPTGDGAISLRPMRLLLGT